MGCHNGWPRKASKPAGSQASKQADSEFITMHSAKAHLTLVVPVRDSRPGLLSLKYTVVFKIIDVLPNV